VFWTGALAVGCLSVVFTYAANWAQSSFSATRAHLWAIPLLITPAGFVLCAYLAREVFPAAQGSGIPQAMAARQLGAGMERRRLLAPRLIIGKIGLTVLGLLCGASVGREGPTVQVGAAIMLQVARLGRIGNERGLILAGSAAGIAAAFNAPLAGIVFAIEEMSRSFEQRTNGLVLYAVIFAGLVSLGLLGNYTYFGTTTATVGTMRDWVLVLLCGVAGGLAGGGFSRLVLAGTRWTKTWIATQSKRNALALPLACGVVVAILGVCTHGASFGTGYAQARSAVEGHPLGWEFWLIKLAATLATSLSGIPGGIFAPSLAVGAGLGSWLVSLDGGGAFSLGAVLGMAGYFAGVVQAPMTAFVIILEMTGNDTNVIPLMLTAVIGFGVSRIICPEPLYHGLAKGFLPDTAHMVPQTTAIDAPEPEHLEP
jgi:H+/Cl- antiporter ClcA